MKHSFLRRLARCWGVALLACHVAVGAQAPTPSAVPVAAPTSYQFSPVNQANISLAAAYWNPIMAYVSEKSGVQLALKIGRTSADTTRFVMAQEVDFVFSNHLFSPEREKLGWRVFGRRLTPALHGQVVVAADSGITDLKQLNGLEVVFPGPEAFVAYKVPYAHLLSLGVSVKPSFGGNMDGALAQLFSGKVVAAGANSQLVEAYARREHKKYRVLWSSEAFHDLALMASARVPDGDVKAVAKAFSGMAKDPAGRAILAQVSLLIGLTDEAYFIPSDGSEYAPYRRFFQTAPASLR